MLIFKNTHRVKQRITKYDNSGTRSVTGQPASWNELYEAAKKALLSRSYEKAEELLAMSYQAAKEADLLADELSHILEQLAEAQWYQSKLRESAATCMELMELTKKVRDPVSQVVCLSNLAIVNHTLNNWQEAEQFYLESLKEIRILLGPDHSYVAKYRSFYAELLNQLDRKEEALALGVQPREVTEFDWQTSKIVSMIQSRLVRVTQTAPALGATANIEVNREEFELLYQSNSFRAERAVSDGDLKLCERLWTFNLKLLESFEGNEQKIVSALDNIAGMQYQQGNLNLSVVTFERSLEAKKKTYGREDIMVARAMHFLAGLYYELADSEKSIAYLRASIRIYEKVLGKEDAIVAGALHNLGTIYHVHHRYEHAEKAYKKALDIKYKINGPEHPDTVGLLKSYAELLAKTGRMAEAQQLNPELTGFITGSWKGGAIPGSAGNGTGQSGQVAICQVCGSQLNTASECFNCMILK